MANEAAEIIRSQISNNVLMSLGAEGLVADTDENGNPQLSFTARILPFNKDNSRSTRPAKMLVFVTLAPSDTYTVTVKRLRDMVFEEHAYTDDVYADQLNTVLLALDYDGEEAFNPRLWNS